MNSSDRRLMNRYWPRSPYWYHIDTSRDNSRMVSTGTGYLDRIGIASYHARIGIVPEWARSVAHQIDPHRPGSFPMGTISVRRVSRLVSHLSRSFRTGTISTPAATFWMGTRSIHRSRWVPYRVAMLARSRSIHTGRDILDGYWIGIASFLYGYSRSPAIRYRPRNSRMVSTGTGYLNHPQYPGTGGYLDRSTPADTISDPWRDHPDGVPDPTRPFPYGVSKSPAVTGSVSHHSCTGTISSCDACTGTPDRSHCALLRPKRPNQEPDKNEVKSMQKCAQKSLD